MRTQKTYCRICEPQCALVAHVEDTPAGEQVIRLTPDKEHPVHKGFACHKGLSYNTLHHDPDRNNVPMARTSGKDEPATFARTTWDEAIAAIAARITDLQTRHGRDALGSYIGNPSAFNATGRDAARRFLRTAGVRYAFGSGTQDCTNKFAASEAVFGTANLHPIPDFAHTRYFLSLGSNPKISHVSFVHMTDPMGALRDIVARGGKVVHVNPRRIESASKNTGDVVQIKPDTDVYFLAALIHTLFAENLIDEPWVAAHASNTEELRTFVAGYDAETVAPVVGIAAEEIRQIAREFAAADGASVHMSTGVNMGRQGTLAYWLVQMLSLLTGNLGRRGGNIYSPGYFPAATVGKPAPGSPFSDTPFGELRRITGSLPGNLLADHIEAGLVRGLIVMSGNPVLSMAGEERLRAALAKLDLLVVIDIYASATAEHADYVLPATDFLERADVNSVSLGFQPEPYVQYTPAVVAPLHERREEWRIFGALAQALGFASPLDEAEPDPFARIDRQFDRANTEFAMRDLMDRPDHTITLPTPDADTLFAVGVQHPEARVDCYPWLIDQGAAACASQFQALQQEDEHTLKLITLRTNYMVNSWMHNIPELKRAKALDNPLFMHPEDLARLGLSDGQSVAVENEHGALTAMVSADEDLRPGVVAMTHGWGHGSNPRMKLASNHPGVNVNALLPTGSNSFDPLSNMSFMTGIPVQVAAAG